MRKQRLGEKDKSEAEVTHKVHVVGTLPDDKAYTATDWHKQFSPHKDNDGGEGASGENEGRNVKDIN